MARQFSGKVAVDRVIVDVSGEPFLDHEKEVMAWIMRD